MTSMRKILGLFLIICLTGSSVVYAAELEAPHTAMRKLQRGFLNIVLAPLDLFAVWDDEKKQETFIPFWLTGLLKGSVFAAGRAVTGVYEMATFPLPLPGDYTPILQPEFAWEHFDKEKVK